MGVYFIGLAADARLHTNLIVYYVTGVAGALSWLASVVITLMRRGMVPVAGLNQATQPTRANRFGPRQVRAKTGIGAWGKGMVGKGMVGQGNGAREGQGNGGQGNGGQGNGGQGNGGQGNGGAREWWAREWWGKGMVGKGMKAAR